MHLDQAIASLLDQGLTRVEIGRRLDIDHRAVCDTARRLGYPPKIRRKTKFDWPAVRAYYEHGHTAGETRRRFGISPGAWDSAIARGEIQRRDEGARPPGKTRAAVDALLREGKTQAQIASALGVSKGTVAYHARGLGRTIDARFSRRYDWAAVQRAHDQGLSPGQCAQKFGFSKCSWTAAVRRGDIVPRDRLIPVERLLVVGRRTSRSHLKSRLIRAGLKENRCEECGISEWRGRPLSIELHHVNGKKLDNRLENLKMLCGNCHSQTHTWGGRNAERAKAA